MLVTNSGREARMDECGSVSLHFAASLGRQHQGNDN